MTVDYDKLPWEERVPLKLGALYETFGYKKYRMGKFEPYDIYRENKNFLKGEGIITFTDKNGRLMALKPDVTMSIVKNLKPDAASEKVYYTENVFRMDHAGVDYREIFQIGLEYIGRESVYAEAEVVALAVKSLADISSDYILGISHMGLLTAVMEACGLPPGHFDALLAALKQKNMHELRALCGRADAPQEKTELLCALAGISGQLKLSLEKLREFPLPEAALPYAAELSTLNEALEAMECSGQVMLDFSVVNDLDYYNGLVFQGYIRKAPRAVLSGGRYDNLVRRFGKPQTAIGFALYLEELAHVFRTARKYDADALVIYGDTPPAVTARAVSELMKEGGVVRAERERPANLRASRVYRVFADGTTEVMEND